MMKQPHTGEDHHHPVFVGSSGDAVVLDGTGGLDDVFDTAFLGPVDVVPEGDKGV